MGRATSVRRRCSEWQHLVAMRRESEVSDREFCRREGVSLATFRWWRSRLRSGKDLAEGSDRPSFLPVTVRASRPAVSEAGAVEILIQGDECRARMRADCPVELAVAITHALRGGQPCS